MPPCTVAQSRALRNEHSPGSRRGPGGSGGTYAVHTQNDDVNTLAVSVPKLLLEKTMSSAFGRCQAGAGDPPLLESSRCRKLVPGWGLGAGRGPSQPELTCLQK